MDMSVVWVDTLRLAKEEKETSGICMKMEAKVVMYLVRGLVERGMMEDKVGVITPYFVLISSKVHKICSVMTGKIIWKFIFYLG